MQWTYGVTRSWKQVYLLSSFNQIGVVGPGGEYFNPASSQVLTSSVHPMRGLLADTSQSQGFSHTQPLTTHQGIHSPANHWDHTIAVSLTIDTAIRIDLTLQRLYILPTSLCMTQAVALGWASITKVSSKLDVSRITTHGITRGQFTNLIHGSQSSYAT